jgi:hypothetical protein
MMAQSGVSCRLVVVLALLVLSIEVCGQEQQGASGSGGPAQMGDMIVEWTVKFPVPPVEVSPTSSAGDGRPFGCLMTKAGERDCLVAWLGDRVGVIDLTVRSIVHGDYRNLVDVAIGRDGSVFVACSDALRISSVRDFPGVDRSLPVPGGMVLTDFACSDHALMIVGGPGGLLWERPYEIADVRWEKFVMPSVRCKSISPGCKQLYLVNASDDFRDPWVDLECLRDGRRQIIDRRVRRPSAIVGDMASVDGRLLVTGFGWFVYVLRGGAWEKHEFDCGYCDGGAWLDDDQFLTWAGGSVSVWGPSVGGAWRLVASHRFKKPVCGVAMRSPVNLVVCLRDEDGLDVVGVKRPVVSVGGPRSMAEPK